MDHEHDTKPTGTKPAESRPAPPGDTIGHPGDDLRGIPPEDMGHASEAKRDDDSGVATAGPIGTSDDAAEAVEEPASR